MLWCCEIIIAMLVAPIQFESLVTEYASLHDPELVHELSLVIAV